MNDKIVVNDLKQQILSQTATITILIIELIEIRRKRKKS